MNKQKNKKLAKFFHEGTPPLKRLKALEEYVHECTPLEKKEVLSENPKMVYGILLDCLYTLDFACERGSGADVTDVLNVLTMLGDLLDAIPAMVRGRWNARSIGQVLSSLLMHRTNWELRRKGMILIVRFIDLMGVKSPSDIKGMLEDAMDFLPFAPPGSALEHHCRSANYAGKQGSYSFCKQQPDSTFSAHVQADRSLLSLVHILRYIRAENHQRFSSFDFWLQMLKTRIFPTLYPRLCQKYGYFNARINPDNPDNSIHERKEGNIDLSSRTSPENDSKRNTCVGFSKCPPHLQEVISKWLLSCFSDASLAARLTATKE